jgi:hypothetical protein
MIESAENKENHPNFDLQVEEQEEGLAEGHLQQQGQQEQEPVEHQLEGRKLEEQATYNDRLIFPPCYILI